MAAQVEPIQIGRILADRYRVDDRLGEGGMGTVWRAFDQNSGRQVVVKAPQLSLLAEDGFHERFQREIRALINLEHPSIVTLFDLGEVEGLPYVVMRYLDGGSLEDFNIRALEKVDYRRTLEWLRQIASALDFVHEHGMVHRDIKPGNILFDEGRNAYLADFGIAKVVAESPRFHETRQITQSGTVVGTMNYMAPEAFREKNTTRLSDQYSLAVTLYEFLSGRRPYLADDAFELAKLHLAGECPRLSGLVKNLPPHISEAIHRGLSTDPQRRFGSCVEFSETILSLPQAVRVGQPPSPPPIPGGRKEPTMPITSAFEDTSPGSGTHEPPIMGIPVGNDVPVVNAKAVGNSSPFAGSSQPGAPAQSPPPNAPPPNAAPPNAPAASAPQKTMADIPAQGNSWVVPPLQPGANQPANHSPSQKSGDSAAQQPGRPISATPGSNQVPQAPNAPNAAQPPPRTVIEPTPGQGIPSSPSNSGPPPNVPQPTSVETPVPPAPRVDRPPAGTAWPPGAPPTGAPGSTSNPPAISGKTTPRNPVESSGAPAGPDSVSRPRYNLRGEKQIIYYTCPWCWRKFEPEEVLWIAEHPSLTGDPRIPRAKHRFLPERFTSNGDALDIEGEICQRTACPRCHLSVPREYLDLTPISFSLLGSPSAGKTCFLTSMSWRLKTVLPTQFELSFSDADPELNSKLLDSESQLFMNEHDGLETPDKTELEGEEFGYHKVMYADSAVEYLRPYIFTLKPRPKHANYAAEKRVSYAVCIYDNAGEHFQPGEEKTSKPVTQHLARSEAYLFVFDPSQHPRFRSAVAQHSKDPQFVGGHSRTNPQQTVLIEAERRIRRMLNLSAHQQNERPLIVLVNKYDAWAKAVKGEFLDPPWVAPAGGRRMTRLDTARIEEKSNHLRELMLDLCPEIVTAAEEFSTNVIYLPTSSFGRQVESQTDGERQLIGVRANALDPMWVEVPILYLLATLRDGVIAKHQR